MGVLFPLDGGQAFPTPEQRLGEDGVWHSSPGMSLRDWFAGRALTGLLEFYKHDQVAAEAYKIADSMVAQRNKWINEQSATDDDAA